MLAPLIRSVNVGMPRPWHWAGLGRTAIDKRAVDGPVAVGRLGLAGDQVADVRHHGGADQAVYAFSRAELDWWETELDRPIRDGQFGENLTVEGMAVDDTIIGERWAIGTAVLEVSTVRIPCNDFRQWQAACGYDDVAWVKRFTLRERPGAYLRVVRPGVLSPGDRIEVIRRPSHGISVSDMFRALTVEPDLLPRLLEVENLAEKARRRVERFCAKDVVGNVF